MAEVRASLYQFGDFCLDPNRRVLLRGGEPVPPTPKALDTLLALVRQSGHVVGKDELTNEVWPDTYVEESNLTQNIFTLRKALGRDRNGNRYIETVPKYGYAVDGNSRPRDPHCGLRPGVGGERRRRRPSHQ
jgi:DNA-binding winged helix-turn-helix (wHTH) protein